MTTTASLGALTVALKLPAVAAAATTTITTAAATMSNDHAVAFAAAV